MNSIFSYRIYLFVSLISLFINGLLSFFQPTRDTERLALIAFIFFTIAVIMAAFDEFSSSRPIITKKIKSFPRKWKK